MRWGPGVVYDPVATNAFFDHPNPANPVTFTTVIPNSGEPTRSCPGVPEEQVYDENTNPQGVRCTLQDYMVNAFGRDSNGWARRGFDNVGVQYGLKGLGDGRDLAGAVRRFQHERRRRRPRPQHHGGADGCRPDRAATPVPHGRDQLGEQPRQGRDHRPARAGPRRVPRRGADLLHARAAHAQLRHGREPGPLARAGAARRRPSFAQDAVFAVDRWLARVARRPPQGPARAQDHRGQARGRRRPLHRRPGQRAVGRACATRRVESYGTPRLAAGEPMTDDVMKCQLKPLVREDYPVTFTDEQWKRLQQAFPAACATTRSPAFRSAARSPGSPTRTARAGRSTAGSGSARRRSRAASGGSGAARAVQLRADRRRRRGAHARPDRPAGPGRSRLVAARGALARSRGSRGRSRRASRASHPRLRRSWPAEATACGHRGARAAGDRGRVGRHGEAVRRYGESDERRTAAALHLTC